MIQAIFREKDNRMEGYATVAHSSSSGSVTVETTEDELGEIFANADVDELAGADEPIESAVEEPLEYRDYLVLEDDEITFDEGYSRNNEG